MVDVLEPMSLKRGPDWPNRFMLAPLTNTQSHVDGVLSDEEFRWLTMRAKGGYGLTMTCAAHVSRTGQGFPGQLGCFDDKHIEGLSRLAKQIKDFGSISNLQLHHAGMRSPKDLIGEAPHCPSDNEETGARALTHVEVIQLREDFIEAAVRAEKAGFDGVEVHGAHGYIVCQFLSAEINQRDDEYGGSLENRSRLLVEIIDGIRARTGDGFQLGVRLSAERFGIQLDEMRTLAQQLCGSGQLDFLDMSLWDVFKEPVEEEFQGRSLASYFTEINRGDTRLGIAGKIQTPDDVRRVLEMGVDFVIQGRAAILQHDFPNRYKADTNFVPVTIPVTSDYLRGEGLSDAFLQYMGRWPDFIKDDDEAGQIAAD